MNEFKCLTSISLSGEQLAGKNEMAEVLDLSSPASFVMTDFTRRSPLIIDSDTSIDEALIIMQKTHQKFKIVVDEKLNMIGAVNTADLMSRKVLMSASQKGVKRLDINVADVMVPLTDLHALLINKLSNACIGDVLNTMSSLGVQYLLVLDNEHKARGIICASDISRALHIPLNINSNIMAHNFKNLFKVLHKHEELA